MVSAILGGIRLQKPGRLCGVLGWRTTIGWIFLQGKYGFPDFFPDGFDLALPCSNHRNSFPGAFPTFNFDWVGEVIGMMSRSKANKWDLVYLVSRRVVMPLPEIGRFKRFKNQWLSASKLFPHEMFQHQQLNHWPPSMMTIGVLQSVGECR